MGDSVKVNGVAVTDVDFNDTTPVAGAGRDLLLWQRSGSGPDAVSAQTPISVKTVLSRATTDLQILNTATETDLFSFTVLGNTLSTNRSLRFIMVGELRDNSINTRTFTLRVKFGGTVLYEDGFSTALISDTNAFPFFMNFNMANQGATNDQAGGGMFCLGEITATTGRGNLDVDEIQSLVPFVGADLAIDSTANKIFVVTGQWSAADSEVWFTRRLAFLMAL